MLIYHSSDAVGSGMPFGGMGTGKLEILPNGLFNAFTFLNNWSSPLCGPDAQAGLLGFHLALSVKPLDRPNSKPKVFLLQTASLQNIAHVKHIRYAANFPKAQLEYTVPVAGLRVTLSVFSSWIPGDIKHSSLPVVFFNLSVHNDSRRRYRVSALFIGRNVAGEWSVGRENKITDEKKHLHLAFENRDSSGIDSREGVFTFSFEKKPWRTSFLGGWNAVTKNFSFSKDTARLDAWREFATRGVLPNTFCAKKALGENQELFGAVCATRELSGGKTANLRFQCSWHFPNQPFGHRYTRWFKSPKLLAGYAIKKRDALERRVDRFKKIVASFPFPEWFNDALIANLSPFISGTWYTANGDFAFYEAPIVCPLMGTLDVGFYGSIPLSYFFPELELSQLRLFAEHQHPDGYIPHDLGKSRIDRPSTGTTFLAWKDLNPKFILMLYRDWLWSKDRAFLRSLYPTGKKALRWIKEQDTDGDGLPDHEGADQTFDLWAFQGPNPYTSSLYLAALLACCAMAKEMHDHDFYWACLDDFARARSRFEQRFWNGKYFGDSCMLSQLNGQWYADLLGLGDIADGKKINQALRTILARNGSCSPIGLVNATLKNGRVDLSNDHSKNVWAGMNYAFIGLCVSRGMALKELLIPARKIWDNAVKRQKRPWNQADTIDSRSGRFVFGDSYYRNMAIWAIPIAYAGRNSQMKSLLGSLRSVARDKRA